MTTNRSRTILSLLTGIAACSWASAASAEVLVAQTRTSPAVYGGATYLVDFNGGAAGGTQFQFTTSQRNTRVAIFFNAECAVEGSPSRWVNIDILVNPAGGTPETVVAPSNGDNALCSGNGTSTASSGNFTLDGWVSAATIGTINLPVAGTHTIRVRVNGGNAGITRLDDMSLIVMR
ncbi:hypothetical protein [Geminicoccus roseus]|uniref:hypothetical protein n=1 Tax=Geminicoccus roseus TaxID=404900 RepID=UPI00041D36DF|nr:hypothetical protein [Geminicoccus roseus]